MRLLTLMCCLVLSIVVPGSASSQDKSGEFIVENTFLNVRVEGRLYRLEALTVKLAAKKGRLPVALINHGKPPGQTRMSGVLASRYLPMAKDFAWRGYLAVAVIRRGFGNSDGPLPVRLNCASQELTPRFESAADDLAAAVKALGSRPDADVNTIVAIGASAGGAAVTAWSARKPAALKAVINVSGGMFMPKCSKVYALVRSFERYGKSSRAPSLWLYSENDRLFPPAVVNRIHEAFLNGGGNVQRIHVGKLRRDGHQLFSNRVGRRIWLGYLDGFLRARGLPTWEIDDVRENLKIAGMRSGSRVSMETYMSLPGVKAMAYSPAAGRVIAYFGRNNLDVVKSRAIRQCAAKTGKSDCRIVMENFKVIPRPNEMSLATPRDKDTSVELLQKLGLPKKRLVFLEAYLDGLNQKAMAKANTGDYHSFVIGSNTLERARRRAIDRCVRRTKGECRIVMEGDKIVAR